MPAPSRRWRRLGLTALGTVAFFFLVAVQVPLFFRRFPRRPETVDFLNYLAAAHVGLAHGWSRIYDLGLQADAYRALSGSADFQWYFAFVSPPPVAWLVAPLTPFGTDAAFWAWDAVSLAALAAACWLCAPWRGLPRLVALLVGFSMYPVLIALQFGQVSVLVGAAVALAWVAIRRGHEVAAGLLLVAVALKPQVGIFVPVALLLAGYRRTFIAWLAGAALLTLASVASLGPAGVEQMLADLAEEQRHLDNQLWTLAYLVGVGAPAVAAEALCVVAALAVGLLSRLRRDATPALVAGLLGSLLGAGYHHSIDFPALLPLALIQLHRMCGWRAAVFAVAGIAAAVVIPPLGPGPLLAFMLAWLAALTGTAVRRRVWRPYVPSTGTMATLPGAAER